MVVEHEQLVRLAGGGDTKAFVELTRRFQQFAFGSALALVRDFQQAEDVVQEAFVAAWKALPTLAEPAAFPGWLRGIVRHHAFRVLRRKQLHSVPLAEAEELPNDDPPADHILEQRRQTAAALAAISELPDTLREPAALFFIHECSHQDIAAFLGLSAGTVNNRLHAARSHLKQRMLTMVTNNLHSQALPDDFANRIGRLIDTNGDIVEAFVRSGVASRSHDRAGGERRSTQAQRYNSGDAAFGRWHRTRRRERADRTPAERRHGVEFAPALHDIDRSDAIRPPRAAAHRCRRRWPAIQRGCRDRHQGD